jgi:hypothetical protein
MFVHGYRNIFADVSRIQFNGFALAQLVDAIVDVFGVASMTYGFISDEVSRRIVRWKPGHLPSYHRWDDGAAVDLVLHEQLGCRQDQGVWSTGDDWRSSPARQSLDLQERFWDRLDRIITYSESSAICVAIPDEGSVARQKAYYNLYKGVTRPLFVKGVGPKVASTAMSAVQQYGWRGAGYPTYHNNGSRGSHHYRLGKYLLLSDVVRRCEYVWPVSSAPIAPFRLSSRSDVMAVRRTAREFDAILELVYAAQRTQSDDLYRVSPVLGCNGDYSNVPVRSLYSVEYANDPAILDWTNGGAMLFAVSAYCGVSIAEQADAYFKQHRRAVPVFVKEVEYDGSVFSVVAFRFA